MNMLYKLPQSLSAFKLAKIHPMVTSTIIKVFYRKNFKACNFASNFGSEIKTMIHYIMNIQNTNSSNFITENKNRILFLFILFILSSLRMFGQSSVESKIVQNKEVITITFEQVETSIVSIDTQIDFVSWFMGSRQSQMNEDKKEDKSNSASTKKQILNSGSTPNKVLYRTFMKKVISQDSAIV